MRAPEKVLLVDDDAAVREGLANALNVEGYLTVAVSDGEQAIAAASVERFDLIILDLSMPRKGGWDTFSCLSQERPEVPVIVLTARPNQLFTSLAAGVGALLEKPVPIPTLLETMRALLKEPVESRLARLTGRESRLHYHRATAAPARPFTP